MSSIRKELGQLASLYEYPEPTVNVDQIRKNNEAWIRKIGLCENEREYKWFLKIDNGLVGCMAYCREPADIAQLGADMIAWLFLFDDKIGEGKNSSTSVELELRIKPFHELCLSGQISDKDCNFQKGLLELLDRGIAIAGEEWRARFARSVRVYFDGLVKEFQVRYENKPLNLESYRVLRRQSIAAYPVLDVIDLKYGRCIEHIGLSKLRDKTADMLGWVNDLCSLDKENVEADPVNIASVMANDFDLKPLDAFIAARDLVHTPDWRLFELRQKQILESDASYEVKDYTHTLRKWVEATFHWSYTTRRYTDLEKDWLFD